MEEDIKVDDSLPFLNDICFDSTYNLSEAALEELTNKGVIFLTKFMHDGKEYHGSVISGSWAEAEEDCGYRGLGEEVVGILTKNVDKAQLYLHSTFAGDQSE